MSFAEILVSSLIGLGVIAGMVRGYFNLVKRPERYHVAANYVAYVTLGAMAGGLATSALILLAVGLPVIFAFAVIGVGIVVKIDKVRKADEIFLFNMELEEHNARLLKRRAAKKGDTINSF